MSPATTSTQAVGIALLSVFAAGIAGSYEWTSVAASAAIRMQELRPSFRRPFGSSTLRPTLSLEVLHQNDACLTQHDKTSEKLAGGEHMPNPLSP